MSAFGGKADIGSSGFVQQRRIVAHQKCIVGYQEKGTTFARSAPASSVRGPGSARNANVCIWFPCVLRKYSRRKPPNSAGVHFQGPLIAAGGLSILEVSMTEKGGATLARRDVRHGAECICRQLNR